jgi:phenylalanyl-tRNA synthetase beta chain
MKVSVSWLKELVDTTCTPAEIAHALTMAGLEVEEMTRVAPPFTGVVVAAIRSAVPHPNADKLRVCEVDAGGATLQIVCGAPNAAAGMKVPCALVGAKLPGIEIKNAKLRGVESFGMLCSARELGLSEAHEGLHALPDDAPIGMNIREYLQLDDTMLTLKLTPNRGDCLGMEGVARDLAAVLGATFRPRVFQSVTPACEARLPVKIEAPDLCGRFSGRVVRSVSSQAKTPDWMRARLERFGQRSVSALVDISNYVMLELGRPSHIFDLDKVAGGLIVRWGRNETEPVELLNGQTVTVDGTVGVIADDVRVEALAGVMGGEATAVSDTTQNIFIEAAFWWPDSIAGRARRFGFATDAAHRFERGTDYATTASHVEYLTQLVLDICGGEAGPLEDQVVALPTRPAVRVRPEVVCRLIGKPISESEMAATFERLACTVVRSGDGLMVTPPSYRFDLTIEEDFVEEVARIHGFDNIPATLTRATTVIIPEGDGQRSRRDLRRRVAHLGYQEVINYAFVEADWERDLAGVTQPVRLANPIASHMSVMRSSLIGGLVATLKSNLNRGVARMRLFELGRCFEAATPDLSVQPERIAGLAFGSRYPEQWGEGASPVDFFAVKGDVEALLAPLKAEFRAAEHPALHPGRTAEIWVGGVRLGVLGELHPRWVQKFELPTAPVVFELNTDVLLSRTAPHYSAASKMPGLRRDLAVIVDENVIVGDIIAAVEARQFPDVKAFEIFDIYRGAQVPSGKKSLAFLILMQHNSRTLTDLEADQTASEITQILTDKFAATLRA